MSNLYIDTTEALEALCKKLTDSDWITVDTEFIREKTYFPQLCLLQVANIDTVACIDVLSIKELEPIYTLLYKTDILKVFHAAGQDMEIFYHLKGELPKPAFDTQLAAGFLGYGEQISYAELVNQILGITLDKSHTRANWANRPLSPQEIQYAADDVRYLRDIYLQLTQDLSNKNRLDWMTHDLDKLTHPNTYRIDPEHVWQRVKHCKKLEGIQLATLQALAIWREEYAIRTDRPRRWIISDETLIDLSLQAPTTTAELEKTQGISNGLIQKQADNILSAIASSLKCPAEQWPIVKKRESFTQKQKSSIQTINKLVKKISLQQSINSTLLATRKDIEQLVLGKRNLPFLQGWRYDIAGCKALELLED